VKGWKNILEDERRLASKRDLRNKAMSEFKLKRVPTLEEAKTLLRLGRRLSEMGKNGIKVTPPRRSLPEIKPVEARFVPGGLPSLGKQR